MGCLEICFRKDKEDRINVRFDFLLSCAEEKG
jgi:hypothetical protein